MTLSLADSVSKLKGVGAKRQQVLKELGILTVYDLLTYFPFRYQDMTVKTIEKIEDKEKVVLKGTAVSEAIVNYMGYKKSRLQFRIDVEGVIISITFFNQPYLKDHVIGGEEIYVYGTWNLARKSLNGIKILSNNLGEQGHEAIYPANKNIKASTIFQLIQTAWEDYHFLFQPILPQTIMTKYDLMDFPQAVEKIHFPKNSKEMSKARYSLIFIELLLYQLKLLTLNQGRRKTKKGQVAKFDVNRLKAFSKRLDFELTQAQKKVINEICKDFLMPFQMNRLLQGDVGSGKTIVAASTILAMKTAGLQSALMAPTEILADQHYESFKDHFNPKDLTLDLLTSSTPAYQRRDILTKLQSGELDLLIGTHALIQDDVKFNNLNYIIIDEQHRFGVNQRRLLRQKGQDPNVLYMTATPIPRTLSITAYGEMDLSIIDELPKGRKPVKTTWIRPPQFRHLKNFLLKELSQGSQAYVISALIDESEFVESENAHNLYQVYLEMVEGQYQVGLLHGQMSTSEKDQVMKEFELGTIDILVSTTVVEVGVNVPNATMMVIHDADKFGLAQLHQLRGRVGRGEKASHCILIAQPKSEVGVERMKIMTETHDGFELSEKDLKMRGAGDIFGSQQSGLPQFKIANLIEDQKLLQIAREEAILIVTQAKQSMNKEYSKLFDKIGLNQSDIQEIFD